MTRSYPHPASSREIVSMFHMTEQSAGMLQYHWSVFVSGTSDDGGVILQRAEIWREMKEHAVGLIL